MKTKKKLFFLVAACAAAATAAVAFTACGEHEHEWSDWVVTDPTVSATGSITRTCNADGCPDKTQEIVLPVLNAENYTASADTATCAQVGKITYTQTFAGYGEYSVEVATQATSVHTISPVAAVAASCIADGNVAHYKCTVCGSLFSDENGVTALTAEEVKVAKETADHVLTPVAAVTATCIADGNLAHYKCTVCENLFMDEHGVQLTNAAEVKTHKEDAQHALVRKDAKQVTCEEDGNSEYWQCSRCDGIFGNASGALKYTGIPYIYKESVPHDYGEWDITDPTDDDLGHAARECLACGHVDEYDLPALVNPGYVTGDSTVTCTDDGYITYVIKPYGCADYISFKIDRDATGHEWGEWTMTATPSTGQYGKLLRRCLHDKSHVEYINSIPFLTETYYTITDTATCTAEGERKFELKSGTLKYKAYGETSETVTNVTDIDGIASPYVISFSSPRKPHSGTWTVETSKATMTCDVCGAPSELGYDEQVTPVTKTNCKTYSELNKTYYVANATGGTVKVATFKFKTPDVGTYTFSVKTLEEICSVSTFNINGASTNYMNTSGNVVANQYANSLLTVANDGTDVNIGKCNVTEIKFVKMEGCAATEILIIFKLNAKANNDIAKIIMSSSFDSSTGSAKAGAISLKEGNNDIVISETNVLPDTDSVGWVYTLAKDIKKSFTIEAKAGVNFEVAIKQNGEWVGFMSSSGKLIKNFEVWEGEPVEFYFSASVAGTYKIIIGEMVEETDTIKFNTPVDGTLTMPYPYESITFTVDDSVAAGTYDLKFTNLPKSFFRGAYMYVIVNGGAPVLLGTIHDGTDNSYDYVYGTFNLRAGDRIEIATSATEVETLDFTLTMMNEGEAHTPVTE